MTKEMKIWIGVVTVMAILTIALIVTILSVPAEGAQKKFTMITNAVIVNKNNDEIVIDFIVTNKVHYGETFRVTFLHNEKKLFLSELKERNSFKITFVGYRNNPQTWQIVRWY